MNDLDTSEEAIRKGEQTSGKGTTCYIIFRENGSKDDRKEISYTLLMGSSMEVCTRLET